MKIKEEFPEIDLIFPIINGKVSMALNRKLFRNFKKQGLDITPEQWTVLAYLWEKDGVSQQQLCDATFKDKPSMTRLIDNIEKQKLVEREAHKNDRRSNLIFLTKKGKGIEEKANAAVYETMESALKGLSEKDIEHVRRLLKIIFDNIKDSL